MMEKQLISVLLVEDHERIGHAITRFMEEGGPYKVTAVGSGEDALEELKHLRVDLVLIDISLPSMSGIDLMETLQSQHPHLPAIMLSAHLNESYMRRSLNAGARGYILKGNPATIFEGIQQVLNEEIFISKELEEPKATSEQQASTGIER